MNEAIRFVGYHVGFSFVGTGVILLFVSLIFFFFIAFVNFPEVRTFIWEEVFQSLILAPIIFALIFVVIQGFVTSLFLGDYQGFQVYYRNSFMHYDYAMAYINMVRGLLSFTSRILTAVGVLLLFSSRMDKPLLPEGFHWLDSGYASYMAVLAVSRHYNNPVVCIFVQMLSSHCQGESPEESETQEKQDQEKQDQEKQEKGKEKQKEEELETKPSPKNPLLAQPSPVYEEQTEGEEGEEEREEEGQKEQEQKKGSESVEIPLTPLKRHLLVRNKLWLMITLTNNPKLVFLRKGSSS